MYDLQHVIPTMSDAVSGYILDEDKMHGNCHEVHVMATAMKCMSSQQHCCQVQTMRMRMNNRPAIVISAVQQGTAEHSFLVALQ